MGRIVDPVRRPRLLAAGMTPESLSGTRPATAFAAAAHHDATAAGASAAAAAAAAATTRSDDACTAPAWRPNTPRGDAPPQPPPRRSDLPARRSATVAAAPSTDGSAQRRGLVPRSAQVVMAHGSQSAASEQVRMIVRGLYN